MKYRQLELIPSQKQERSLIERLITEKSSGESTPLQILEAGCGNSWPYKLKNINYVLTGIDVDTEALNIRKNTLADLDVTIVGDLTTAELQPAYYDIIYCSFVLEHVKQADAVLMNFSRWIKPGGLLIIRIPDPHSVYGFITRITPHWFHVLYYKYLLKKKNAGKPGYAPYPTHYNPVVSRSGIRKFCETQNFILSSEYGDGYVHPGSGYINKLIKLVKKTFNLLSFGRLSDRHTNILYILSKQP